MGDGTAVVADVSNSALGAAGYRQAIDGCLTETIGVHGLSQAVIKTYLRRLEPALASLKEQYRSGELPLLRIAQETADIDAARAALARLSEGARTIVFFGTGGSALGGQTLAQVAGWNIPGGAQVYQDARPRTRFYDNLDPSTQMGALEGLDLAATRFVVISKSGNTVETLVQAITALSAVRSAGLSARIPELFLGITEPAADGIRNGLRDLFAAHAIPMLDHHTGIGGRFSCLTNVGLVPAMARGLDARAIRNGANTVVEHMLRAESASDFAPCVGAALGVAMANEKGIRTLVLMPYADRLARLAHWFAQLWAESLGKSGAGTSPIAALGPRDQHSQLQLYMDGPRDHYITVIRVKTAGMGPEIDAQLAQRAGAAFIGRKTVGDIVDAQAVAVTKALAEAGRPVRTIDIEDINEGTIGALLMHFMLETILAAHLLEVDPFGQPAVEKAKVLTRQRLSPET